MSNTCPICFTENVKLLTLPCKCKVCNECFYNWCKSRCEDNLFALKILIPCPLDKCRKPMSSEVFIKYLNKEQKLVINELLLKNYMLNTKDISKCPKEGCDYGGISGYLQKKCSNYICEKCKTKWQDQNMLNSTDRIKNAFMKVMRVKNEFCSNFVKLFIGNYCPNCSVHIQKLDGCSHMVCSKCKYEFCWLCLDAYYGYRHSGTRPCGLRPFYLVFMTLLLLFPLFARLSFTFPSLSGIFGMFVYFITRFGIGLLIAIGTVAIPVCGTIGIYHQVTKQIYCTWSIYFIVLGLYIAGTVAYIGLTYILYQYSMLMEVWRMIFFCTIDYFSLILFVVSLAISFAEINEGFEQYIKIGLGTALFALSVVLITIFGRQAFQAHLFASVMIVIFATIYAKIAVFNNNGRGLRYSRFEYSKCTEIIFIVLLIIAFITGIYLLWWYKYWIVLKIMACMFILINAIFWAYCRRDHVIMMITIVVLSGIGYIGSVYWITNYYS